jgi:hypothetical protein
MFIVIINVIFILALLGLVSQYVFFILFLIYDEYNTKKEVYNDLIPFMMIVRIFKEKVSKLK